MEVVFHSLRIVSIYEFLRLALARSCAACVSVTFTVLENSIYEHDSTKIQALNN